MDYLISNINVQNKGTGKTENINHFVNNDMDENLLNIKTAENSVQLSSNTSENVEMYESDGIVLKVKKNDSSASFSFKTKVSKYKTALMINAKNCTIEVVSSSAKNLEVTTKGSKLVFNLNESVKKLTNSANDSTINGSSGDDYISNRAKNCIINSENGNDKIINRGSKTTINAGDGNDNIKNRSSYCTINAGDGDDTIKNTGGRTTINAGAGNDNIDNQSGSKGVVINGDDGDDTISSQGHGTTINGGAGNDNITLASRNLFTNYSTKGKEEVIQKLREQRLSKVDGGEGNDTITNSAYYVDIDNAEENDNITVIQPEDKTPCGKPTLFARKIDTKINYKSLNTENVSKEAKLFSDIKNAKTIDDVKHVIYSSSNALSYETWSKIMEIISSLQNDTNIEEAKKAIENLL